jgi:hypothetical protein
MIDTMQTYARSQEMQLADYTVALDWLETT